MDWRQAGQQSSTGGAWNCYDFQNYTVYPRMTVLENVELGLRLRGIDEKEIGKRTLEVLELLDLVEVRFAKVKTCQICGNIGLRCASHDFGTRCNPHG